jgi:hypothetical protein
MHFPLFKQELLVWLVLQELHQLLVLLAHFQLDGQMVGEQAHLNHLQDSIF